MNILIPPPHGGPRLNAGRPKIPDGRCLCGKYTTHYARVRGHHCDNYGTITGKGRRKPPPVPLTLNQRWQRIMNTVQPRVLDAMLTNLERALGLRGSMGIEPEAEGESHFAPEGETISLR